MVPIVEPVVPISKAVVPILKAVGPILKAVGPIVKAVGLILKKRLAETRNTTHKKRATWVGVYPCPLTQCEWVSFLINPV